MYKKAWNFFFFFFFREGNGGGGGETRTHVITIASPLGCELRDIDLTLHVDLMTPVQFRFYVLCNKCPYIS